MAASPPGRKPRERIDAECARRGKHRLGDALPIVADLQHDPTPRVRAAASRAVVLLTSSGA